MASIKDRKKRAKEQYKYRHSKKGKISNRRHALKKYNLTLEQYDQMYKEQNGVCKICGEINENGQRLAIDHNHKTGKIRGLLCTKCNIWLGNFESYRNLFKEFKKYLRSSSSRY